MLNVFFTVDVEIWCGGWTDIDRRFPEAFDNYVHGAAAGGGYGLSHQLKGLSDRGLTGVFFVEPLFSTRFGQGPLEDIVGMILDSGHEVQLHLHPEWVDESREPLITNTSRKRQSLFEYSLDEQQQLIAAGRALLHSAGAPGICAFRAGGFGFNRNTLKALEANGIPIDSSYNATQYGLQSGIDEGQILVEPMNCEGILEYPMTVFRDGRRQLRHTQLTACSFGELEHLLWESVEQERSALVILSHNFELLSPSKKKPDPTVIRRFHRLCGFLERHSDLFRVGGFRDAPKPPITTSQPPPLEVPLRKTAVRFIEQAWRRRLG